VQIKLSHVQAAAITAIAAVCRYFYLTANLFPLPFRPAKSPAGASPAGEQKAGEEV